MLDDIRVTNLFPHRHLFYGGRGWKPIEERGMPWQQVTKSYPDDTLAQFTSDWTNVKPTTMEDIKHDLYAGRDSVFDDKLIGRSALDRAIELDAQHVSYHWGSLKGDEKIRRAFIEGFNSVANDDERILPVLPARFVNQPVPEDMIIRSAEEVEEEFGIPPLWRDLLQNVSARDIKVGDMLLLPASYQDVPSYSLEASYLSGPVTWTTDMSKFRSGHENYGNMQINLTDRGWAQQIYIDLYGIDFTAVYVYRR